MNDQLNFLITFCQGGETLLQVALLTTQWASYDSEHLEENRSHLLSLLPLHVRTVGPIVKVERLFDVVVAP